MYIGNLNNRRIMSNANSYYLLCSTSREREACDWEVPFGFHGAFPSILSVRRMRGWIGICPVSKWPVLRYLRFCTTFSPAPTHLWRIYSSVSHVADKWISGIHMFPRPLVRPTRFWASNYSDTGIRLCSDRRRCMCADRRSIARVRLRPVDVAPRTPARRLFATVVCSSSSIDPIDGVCVSRDSESISSELWAWKEEKTKRNIDNVIHS